MTGRAAQGMERCGAPPTRRTRGCHTQGCHTQGWHTPRGPDITPSFSPGRASLFSGVSRVAAGIDAVPGRGYGSRAVRRHGHLLSGRQGPAAFAHHRDSVLRRRAVCLLLLVAVLAVLFAAPCAPARAAVIERTGADWTLAAPAGGAIPAGGATSAGDAIPAGGTAPAGDAIPATPAGRATTAGRAGPARSPGPAGPAGAEATDPRTPHPVSPWRALHPSQGSHPPLPSHGSHGIPVPDPEAQP